jgi:hypothetical protein
VLDYFLEEISGVLSSEWDPLLESFELGELLHQLFYAVLLKLYCNLRVVPIALAAKDRSFAIFRVAHTRTLAQAGLSRGRRDIESGT